MSRIEVLQEEQRRKETALTSALAKKTDPKKEYAKNFGLGPFGNLPKKARKIIDCSEDWDALRRMLLHRSKWVRPVKEWKPRGKAMSSILKSLITHLFCEYPMPAFWYSVWHTDSRKRSIRKRVTDTSYINLFISLAQGESLYKLIKAGKFIIPFTKKQCHAFMAQRTVKDVVSAVRWTQIKSFDGDNRMAMAVCDTDWGEWFADRHSEEAFRSGIIQWFCNQGMIDPVQVGPLIDFINHSRMENPEWAIKGRTGQSLMRSMQEWHDELAQQRVINRFAAATRKPPPEKFDSCGISGWHWNKKTKDKRTGRSIVENWRIKEILTYEDLHTEGQELKHCVVSYAWSIVRKDKAIYSLQCNQERRLTIEVHVPTRTIVQARGYLNKAADTKHIDFMRRWANDEDISLAARVMRA